jgi:phage shock protein PspC (stress-responsive transcriptional regulator)
METKQEGSTNAVRPLRRRADDRMIAGVAGGIGDYTGLDPVIFRIGFIALALAGGAGIALYLLAWLLIPKASEERSHAEHALMRLGGLPAWAGVAFIGIAIAMIFGSVGFWDAKFIWALGLMAVGFVLLRDETQAERSPPPPDSDPGERGPVPDSRGGAESAAALDEGPGAVTVPTTAGAPSTPPTVQAPLVAAPATVAARPPRERSSLGWFTLAAMLIAIGVAAVLENWEVLELDVGQFFALALTVVGAGLLVGAWWGRARLMMVLGVLLVPVVLASSLIDMPLRGTVGDTFLTPLTVSDLKDRYEVLAGSVTLDLTELRLDENVRVRADVAIGDLNVIVPRGVRVLVSGTAQAGRLRFFGHEEHGVDLQRTAVAGDPDAERTITLDINAGIGSADVYWSGPYVRPRSEPRSGGTANSATESDEDSSPGRARNKRKADE